MNEIATSNTVTIDGIDYLIDNLSKSARLQVESILFTDERVSQLRNELAVSNTARSGYLKLLKIGLA